MPELPNQYAVIDPATKAFAGNYKPLPVDPNAVEGRSIAASTNPATLQGGPVGGYTPYAGGVPSVPNPGSTAATAVTGNLANFGDITKLGAQTNQFNNQQALAAYQANMPLYGQLTGQASQNILNNLQGQLSPDVQALIAGQAAQRGISTGAPGSPNSGAAMLRSLGLTGLDLQNLGQSQLNSAIGRTPIGAQFDPSKFYVTPEAQQKAQEDANKLAGAPVPYYAQLAGFNALNQGLNRGYNASGPQGSGGGSGSRPTTQSGQLASSIVQKYAPTAMPNTGYGQAWNSQGGYASTGNEIPPDFGNMSEADQLDWLSGIDTTSMAGQNDYYYQGFNPETGEWQDTSGSQSESYYPDFGELGDTW